METVLKLETAINLGWSSFELEIILNSLDGKEFVKGCEVLQKAPSMRGYALNLLSRLKAESISANFSEVLGLLKSERDSLRTVAIEGLQKLSSQELVSNLDKLLMGLQSQYFFIRFYSEELIEKIELRDLRAQKEVVIRNFLENYLAANNDSTGIFVDWRRVIAKLLDKLLREFSAEETREHWQLLSITKDMSPLKMATAICHLKEMYFQIRSEGKSLSLLWKKLSSYEKWGDEEVVEKVARIKIQAIAALPKEEQAVYLDYLVQISRSFYPVISLGAKEMALGILANNPEIASGQLKFLLDVWEDENYFLRRQAKRIVKSFSLADWVGNLPELLVRYERAGRDLRKLIKNSFNQPGVESFLDREFLKRALEAQRSIDEDYRQFAREQALKISNDQLNQVNKLLERLSKEKQKYTSRLARELLEKIK